MLLFMTWISNEIASCHEKAYATLPLADATRLLFFKSESETVEFGQGVSHHRLHSDIATDADLTIMTIL